MMMMKLIVLLLVNILFLIEWVAAEGSCTIETPLSIQQRNEKLVKDGVIAFSKGDFPSFLSILDENVDWEVTSHSQRVPHFRNYKGATSYFYEFQKAYQVLSFVPKYFAATENVVLWHAEMELKSNLTGKRQSLTLNAIFTIDDKTGKVIKVRDQVDTAAVLNLNTPGYTAYDNEVLLTKWLRSYNSDWETALKITNEIFAEDAIFIGWAPTPFNLKQYLDQLEEVLYSPMTDFRYTIIDIAASSTGAFCRYSAVGKHTKKEVAGIPPKGKKWEYFGLVEIKTRDGKIVESYIRVDVPALIEQLK